MLGDLKLSTPLKLTANIKFNEHLSYFENKFLANVQI